MHSLSFHRDEAYEGESKYRPRSVLRNASVNLRWSQLKLYLLPTFGELEFDELVCASVVELTTRIACHTVRAALSIIVVVIVGG